MKKTLTLSLLVFCIFALILSGCSKEPAGDAGENAVKPVYWLSSHPEAEDELNALAAEYEALTGVKVSIKCVSEEEYSSVLESELYSDEPPVIFECTGLDELRRLNDRCYDLSYCEAAATLADDASALSYNGKTLGIPFCTEYSGIIVNTALLDKAGIDISSINSLDALRSAAEDIHSKAAELGFDAFAPASLNNEAVSGFAEPLANAALYYESLDDAWTDCPENISGKYLDKLKAVWDMLIDCSSCDTESILDSSSSPLDAFADSKAAFCLGSSSELALLSAKHGMSDGDLSMIPMYFGVDDEHQGLCKKCGTYLAVNAPAANGVIKQTLDFLTWISGDERGLELMSQTFGELPFVNAPESNDKISVLAAKLSAEGKPCTDWIYRLTPNSADWYAIFAHMLGKYSQDGDWSRVSNAFIGGWAVQFAATKMPG